MGLKVLLIGAVALLLGACSTNKELVATGGSRADGTIQLSYEVGAFQKANLSFEQGIATARERCRAWGYSDAEPFGGQTRQCQAPSQYGCMQWFISMNYQCLGGNRPS